MNERSYAMETLTGLKEYVSHSAYNCKGELFAERDGFLVETISYGHTYYIKFIVNQRARVAMIEIAPGITCDKCYQRAFDAYVSPINDANMIFKFLRSETGRVYLYYAQSLSGGPISAENFSELESRMVMHLIIHFENLERVTHGEPPCKPKSVAEIRAEIRRMNREHEYEEKMALLEEAEEEDGDDGFPADEEPQAEAISIAECETEPDGSDGFDRARRLLARLAAERFAGPVRLVEGGENATEEPWGEDGGKALSERKNGDAAV